MAKRNILFETMWNSYRTVKKIGEGGAGTVYEVTDQDSNSFALKILSPTVVSNEKIKRFKNEMDFLSKNRHDNVVAVLDKGFINEQEKKIPFYVMPLYSQTLRTLITNNIRTDRVLPYFSQILDGVEALHLNRVWHRDLKPENILYDENTDKLLVADLGVAHFEEENLHTSIETKPNSRLANFEYAAPEQRRRGMLVDKKADIYALGLILNEMFTGKVLQGTGHQTIETVAQDYSYLDELVDLMVRQSPDKRPNSIDSIKLELIARKNDFVQRQKINELENTVISTSEIADILIADPVRIIDVDYEYGSLKFTLNHNVTNDWASEFKNPRGSFTYLMGNPPETFHILGNIIIKRASEQDAQAIANFLREYLPRVNEQYKNMRINRQKEQEQRQRIALQEETERKKKELEVKNSILKNIKF